MLFHNSLDFARERDELDPLQNFRNRFHIPQHDDGDAIYFTGNSLGLQPKAVRSLLEQELSDWAALGVEGHFRATHPWVSYHILFEEPLARIVGALPHEVVAMNSLTVNLHLMLATFYQPTGTRTKILCEAGAFPSDQYALETHVRMRGLHPDDVLVEIVPRAGEHTLRTDDILYAIDKCGEELALVMFSGVQYYTGQAFPLQALTQAAHSVGALAGFDLAHAVGNVALALHDWDVDFAVWCSYKYLNSGPGGVAGAFIHERHARNTELPRLAGWWGNEESERFQMKKGFRPAKTAAAWQLSNAPVLAMAAHKAALDIFDDVGMEALCKKRDKLTSFLEFVLRDIANERVSIITPAALEERGCQLSLFVEKRGKELFDALTREGVIVDWREPNVIRAAPVPLYNSFEDVWRFGDAIRTFFAEE